MRRRRSHPGFSAAGIVATRERVSTRRTHGLPGQGRPTRRSRNIGFVLFTRVAYGVTMGSVETKSRRRRSAAVAATISVFGIGFATLVLTTPWVREPERSALVTAPVDEGAPVAGGDRDDLWRLIAGEPVDRPDPTTTTTTTTPPAGAQREADSAEAAPPEEQGAAAAVDDQTEVVAPTTAPDAPPTETPAEPAPAMPLLDAGSSTLEASMGHWAPWFSSVVSLGAAANTGNYGLLVLVTQPHGWGIHLDNWPGFAATPGPKTLAFSARASRFGLGATMTARWRDASGGVISASAIGMDDLSANHWQRTGLSVVAPSGTVSMTVEVTHASGLAGDMVYLDDIVVLHHP